MQVDRAGMHRRERALGLDLADHLAGGDVDDRDAVGGRGAQRDPAERSAVVGGGAVTPVPLSATLCGLALPLSLIVTEAERDPVVVGVKLTLMVQLPLTASVAGLTGQLFV